MKTGALESGEVNNENQMYDIATAIPDLDAIVFGHTHNQVESAKIGNVLVMQPKNWGISLGRMDFTLDDSSGGCRVPCLGPSRRRR